MTGMRMKMMTTKIMRMKRMREKLSRVEMIMVLLNGLMLMLMVSVSQVLKNIQKSKKSYKR